MLYTEFSNRLSKYLDTYANGLKKQANREMSEIVSYLGSLQDADKDCVLLKFLADYCDNGVWDALKQRGNADIPYELKEYILSWITPRCEEKKMPELRWYYELYINHRTGCQFAVKCLEDAYSSKECDLKTTDLLFDSYLDTLGWGAHHFPQGCIIENNIIELCMQKCEEILKEKPVSDRLADKFQYYKVLYACYKRYVDEGRKRDFNDYLREAGIDPHGN